MAYSILQQPELYAPAYNDQMYVVTSSNNGQANFNYIAQVYIGSDIITLKAPANPTYGSGVFNIGRIIENYVNSDINKGYGIQQNTNSFKAYYVRFGEEYGATVTQYLNITQTVNKYVWNGIFDFLDYQTFTYADYSLDGNGLLLSYASQFFTQKVLDNDYHWLHWFANDTTVLSHIEVKSYSSTGALIKTVGVQNPALYQSSGTIANHFMRFGAGKAQLNQITTPDLKYGTTPVMPTNATSYTVGFQNSSSGVIAGGVTYNIQDADCKYTNYRLHFLNELGGFDAFNFTKLSRTETDINRMQYKAPIGALTSSSTFGYSKMDRGDRQYFISTKETIKIKSDWLTDLEYTMLKELVESPEIYLDDPVHGLVSVTCSASRFDSKTVLTDKLFNLELDVKYSFDRYRQRY